MVLEKEINSYVKIIDIETLNCPSLVTLKQRSSYSKHCPYGHRSTNCALNNVYHISKWILQYWNSLCDEHDKNVIRLKCWDCMII